MRQQRHSWEHIHSICGGIWHDIRESDFKPTAIVAITRGGMVPGTILSYFLNCPVYTIGIKSYTDDNKSEHIHVTQNIDMSLFDVDDNHSILIVDDICDSGKTLEYVYNLFDRYNKQSATVFTRKLDNPIFIPTYPGEMVTDEWVVFPWG